jgi:type II secretion system (T2SS) protein E
VTATLLTPELVLVDPELAEQAQRQTNRKAAMSSTEPANGMFFVDQAQPEPAPEPQISPLTPPAPVEPPPVAAAPEAAPAPEAPAPAPAPVPPPAAVQPTEPPGTTPMVDVPLGTLIFRAGLLAEEQLEDALQEGMRTGKRLGEVLIERGWIAEKDLGRMLAGQKGLPYIEVTAADAQPDALRALPEQNARLQVALPLYYENGQLTVAVADPSNELVIENLRRALGAEPQLVVAPHGELLRAIGEAYASLTAAPPPAPAPAPDPAPAPEPVPVQAVEPAPEPAPVPLAPTPAPELVTHVAEPQPEPVQPLAPTPLPTVLPPAEERSAELHPAPAPLQASVAEAVPEHVQPLAPAPEPVVEAPAPVAEAPAPVAELPLAQHVQPVEEPPAVEQPAPVEPVQPVPPPAPAAETPVEPAPVAPAPDAAPEPQQPEAAPATVDVILRLSDGETLEVGTFSSDLEATTWAQEIVRQISSAEGQSTWPFFANRYLRPDTIVSVDLVEQSGDQWLGSSVRRKSWAESQ